MSLGFRLRQIAIFFATRGARLLFHYPKIAYAWKTRFFRKKRSFITESIPGNLAFDNNRFAIFLIWQPNDISWYVKNAFDALSEAKINTVLVVNHTLTSDIKTFLLEKTRHILIRDNTGFDIGGYQDATQYVRDTYDVERLIYINDSIYFFKDGLSELFSRLANSTSDVCTVFENWEIRYHVQSFCFSIGRRVFNSRSFIDFWDKYLPVNSRLWAIQHGEIGLSRAIVPAATSFEIIYNPNDLRTCFKDMTAGDLLSLNKYLPIRIRFQDTERRPQKISMEDQLIDRISTYSQVHTGGFLYRQFLGSPIIKRDLVYRVQFSIYDVENCLAAAGHEGHLQEILSDMRKKGVGNQLPLLKKIQFMDGII